MTERREKLKLWLARLEVLMYTDGKYSVVKSDMLHVHCQDACLNYFILVLIYTLLFVFFIPLGERAW